MLGTAGSVPQLNLQSITTLCVQDGRVYALCPNRVYNFCALLVQASAKAVGGEALDMLARGTWLRRDWERQEEERCVAEALAGIAGG